MAWNIWSFRPGPASQVAMPYSAFVSQVTSDNVASARIDGDHISGAFVHPVVWPDTNSTRPFARRFPAWSAIPRSCLCSPGTT
jgi:hypothetical protein